MTSPSSKQKEINEKVYCGLVYMGDEEEAYKKYFAEKYGKDAELRNSTCDDIHGDRAELYATKEILDRDFGGRPKLIS